jgi:hypothetical protein
VMQQIDPNFDERNAGFNRFSKFVVEAGQKGVVLVSKLDNGQYEVAPPAGGVAGTSIVPAAGRPARDSGEAARDENGRRGRGRRGRGRERAPGRERTEEVARDGARDAGREGPPPRAVRGADGALTLARAFQLLTQALAELRAPVPHEALRLRMVALHGREDSLLDAARFPRMLRQANDAEVADVRKLGDDEYEISPHRTTVLPPIAAPQGTAASASGTPAPGADAGAAEAPVDQAGRDNGQRLGLRFRRGSRGPLRAGEIPMIGVVQIDAPAAAAAAPTATLEAALEDAGSETPVAKKPARPRRAPRKRAPAAAVVPADSSTADRSAAEPPAEAARKPRRPRPRAKKKAE